MHLIVDIQLIGVIGSSILDFSQVRQTRPSVSSLSNCFSAKDKRSLLMVVVEVA